MIGVDAVSFERIGIIRDRRYWEAFLRRLLRDDEIAVLGALDAPAQVREVAGLMAAKEAVIKASSSALSLDDIAGIRIERDPRRGVAGARRAAYGASAFCVSVGFEAKQAIACASPISGI